MKLILRRKGIKWKQENWSHRLKNLEQF
jgi:hypothetical protein